MDSTYAELTVFEYYLIYYHNFQAIIYFYENFSENLYEIDKFLFYLIWYYFNNGKVIFIGSFSASLYIKKA